MPLFLIILLVIMILPIKFTVENILVLVNFILPSNIKRKYQNSSFYLNIIKDKKSLLTSKKLSDNFKLKLINKLNLEYLPICVAKTQYSISDDAKKLGFPKNNDLTVQDIVINQGAGFITILLGKIVTMPGLPKNPNYEKIDVVDNQIIGIF